MPHGDAFQRAAICEVFRDRIREIKLARFTNIITAVAVNCLPIEPD
jgi:hypothetical protein